MFCSAATPRGVLGTANTFVKEFFDKHGWQRGGINAGVVLLEPSAEVSKQETNDYTVEVLAQSQLFQSAVR